MEWSLKKHQLTYIDFAPDASCVTETGFAPHWAFLTNEGEILCCDFLALLPQTTLIKAKQAEKCDMYEKFDKLYYKDGKCGVLYKQAYPFGKLVPHTKLILYS